MDNESGEWAEEFEQNPPELLPNIKMIVVKVRKIVVFLRKSAKRMEVLEKYTHKTPLKDMPTRWDSMLTMLERHVDIEPAIYSALKDLGKGDMFPEKNETEFIVQIVDAIAIVSSASIELQKRDCTLAEADRVLEFSLKELSELDSSFSERMYFALESRILERRNKVLSTLHAYLENSCASFNLRPSM